MNYEIIKKYLDKQNIKIVEIDFESKKVKYSEKIRGWKIDKFRGDEEIVRDYTITSVKKLGIDKWSYIKIPNIPLEQQQRIVDEIKAELDQKEEIKKQIENERNKIDELILQSITELN